MLLWVLASLLTLVEGGFSEEGDKEVPSLLTLVEEGVFSEEGDKEVPSLLTLVEGVFSEEVPSLLTLVEGVFSEEGDKEVPSLLTLVEGVFSEEVPSLLTLVEGVFSEEGDKEVPSLLTLVEGVFSEEGDKEVPSLLTLVEGVFSEEGDKEVPSLLTLVEGVFSEEDLLTTQGRASQLGQESHIHDLRAPLFEDLSPLEGEEEVYRSRWRRYLLDTSPHRAPSRWSRKKPKRSSRDCRMQKKQMRVRDLGLGFDSDEIVLFKYCVGTCRSSRKNYDMALKALMDNGSISERKVSAHPCCRPTRYKTVSFMDAQTFWRTIRWLSAASCGCVG